MSAIRIYDAHGKPAWLEQRDPYWSLTQRQRQVLDVVRGHNGNRHAAARTLSISYQAVQHALKIASDTGVVLPPLQTRGRDLSPRANKPEPCGVLMERSAVPCGRGAGHRGFHRTRDRRLGAA